MILRLQMKIPPERAARVFIFALLRLNSCLLIEDEPKRLIGQNRISHNAGKEPGFSAGKCKHERAVRHLKAA